MFLIYLNKEKHNMSKKKSYNNYAADVESAGSTATETEVVETTVEETTTETVATEEPVVETDVSTEETPVTTTEEASTETVATEEVPATPETPATEEPVVTETPAATETASTETPAASTSEEQKTVAKAKILVEYNHDEEMNRVYTTRYAISTASKRFAVLKQMSLNNMYKTFVSNRICFIACTSADDYNRIADFMLNNKVYYNRIELTAMAKTQFLAKLRECTEYAIIRWR
jgi:hypothetical protein